MSTADACPWLSVLIPVYNVEACLDESMTSVPRASDWNE